MDMDPDDRRAEFGIRYVDKESGLVLCKFCDEIRDLDSWCYAVNKKGPYILEVKHHASFGNLHQSAVLGCRLCTAVLELLKMESPDWQSIEEMKLETIDPEYYQITCCGALWSDGVIFAQKKLFNREGKKSLLVWLEGFTKKGDPLSNHFFSQKLVDRSNSNECFDLIHYWMRTCKSDHKNCSWDEACILPSRVIDIGPSSGSIFPKLLITNGAKGPWITLSHCWGGQVPVSTTLATLSNNIETLPLDELPPTFRDAVVITRKLGFRYLWVDALCIIQDSPEDWAAESTKMHEIYSKGVVNICASAARNAEEGIFESSSSNKQYNECVAILPCYSARLQIGGDVGFRLPHQQAPKLRLSAEALHKRAWVLQESVLSPRRLDFGSSNIFWKCCTDSLSDACPERSYYNIRLMEPLSVGNIFQISSERLSSYPRVGINNNKDHMSFWYATLRNYMQRNITFHNDILPAISGVAHNFQERTGYHYMVGLWLEDFHRGLLWQSDGPITRAKSTNNPSWSWASTNIPWVFPCRNFETMTEYLDGSRATIIELKVTTYNDNPFASVITSTLRIRGLWRGLDHWRNERAPVYNKINDSKELWKTTIGLEEYRADIPTGRIICTMDDRSDPGTWNSHNLERDLICFQIAKFGRCMFNMLGIMPTTIYGLILEPTHRTPNEYRRVGIVEITEEDRMFEGWDVKIVSIV